MRGWARAGIRVVSSKCSQAWHSWNAGLDNSCCVGHPVHCRPPGLSSLDVLGPRFSSPPQLWPAEVPPKVARYPPGDRLPPVKYYWFKVKQVSNVSLFTHLSNPKAARTDKKSLKGTRRDLACGITFCRAFFWTSHIVILASRFRALHMHLEILSTLERHRCEPHESTYMRIFFWSVQYRPVNVLSFPSVFLIAFYPPSLLLSKNTVYMC